jgi:hypothetical protein
VQLTGGPAGAFAGGRLQQRRIVRDVIAGQRRNLVADLMSGMGFQRGEP